MLFSKKKKTQMCCKWLIKCNCFSSPVEDSNINLIINLKWVATLPCMWIMKRRMHGRLFLLLWKIVWRISTAEKKVDPLWMKNKQGKVRQRRLKRWKSNRIEQDTTAVGFQFTKQKWQLVRPIISFVITALWGKAFGNYRNDWLMLTKCND